MAPRRRCPTCGSKQWHREPSSGLIACSEGHVLQDYRNETTEITEVGPHAMKKRTLKSGRKKNGERSNADPKLYHGARGRYHYFLCLQLILRKQIGALVKLWDLPAEFELVCRDIWALHLSLLPDPPPAEPYHHHAQGTRAGEEGPNGVKEKSPLDPMKEKDELSPASDDSEESEGENGERREKDDDLHPKVDEEEEVVDDEEEDDEDSELDALMRENSDLSSSSSDGDGTHKPPTRKKFRRKGKARGRSSYESPVSTVSVLVLACWTLRIPVMIRDLTKLIESYELPYLDPVLRILPTSMVQHLTKHNVQALSPPHAPSTIAVHSIASRLAKKLYATYGVYTPECNAASMLWRLTKDMGGTPMLYRLAKRVASVVSVPLTLHSSLAPELARLKAHDPARHQYDNAPPEVALLACVIIVLKMVYGLDGQERAPKDADDVACALPRAKEYLREIGKIDKEDLQKKEAKFSSRHRLNVGDMKEDEMDDYIKFCETVLIGQGTDGDAALERYFPVRQTDSKGGLDEVDGGMYGRGLRGMEVAEEGLRAGAEYKIWNWRDVDGTMEREYGGVVSRAAVVVGVSIEYLGGVMSKYERRIVHSRARVGSTDDITGTSRLGT
ncbi:hypothetical protein BDZ97DRAFT_1935346 [Flammula alnicola]|nr:hypothetical protein BDZ97DRAFT_1935346 [Flammula alnicola]